MMGHHEPQHDPQQQQQQQSEEPSEHAPAPVLGYATTWHKWFKPGSFFHHQKLGEFDAQDEDDHDDDGDDDDDDDGDELHCGEAGVMAREERPTDGERERERQWMPAPIANASPSKDEIFGSWWEIERALLSVTTKLFSRLKLSAFSIEGAATVDPIALTVIWMRQRNQGVAIRSALEQNIGQHSVAPSADTMSNLWRASRYACAAYGTALKHIRSVSDVIENGFFAQSFRNFNAFVEESLAPMPGAASASQAEQSHDDVLCTLLPQTRVMHSEWEATLFSPSCYIAIDHQLKWIVLAVRGTLHSNDAVTDACADSVQFLHGWAHAGMCAAAWQMVSKQLPKLSPLLLQFPSYELVLTGHSMGGGVAALLTMLLHSGDKDVENAAKMGLSSSSLDYCANQQGNGALGVEGTQDIEELWLGVERALHKSRCYAIGVPSLVSLNLSLDCSRYVFTAVCGKDIVPRLCIDNVKSLVDQLVGAAPLNRTIQAFKKVGQSIRKSGKDVAKANEGLVSTELRDHSSSDFMVPPGCTIHLRHLNAEGGPVCEIRHPTAFSQIHLSPRMFVDHFPTLYMTVLEKICKMQSLDIVPV